MVLLIVVHIYIFILLLFNLTVNNTNTMYLNDEFDHRKNPINSVLKEMGIEKTNGHDEFDTIGLGKYRSNTDFE